MSANPKLWGASATTASKAAVEPSSSSLSFFFLCSLFRHFGFNKSICAVAFFLFVGFVVTPTGRVLVLFFVSSSRDIDIDWELHQPLTMLSHLKSIKVGILPIIATDPKRLYL